MAELNNFVGTANDIFFVVNESSRADDGLADDDSWVENISQSGDDLNEFDTLDEAACDAEDKISRGYGSSALDFTLHTIVEESCEETELEHFGEDVCKEDEENCSNGSRMSPSYLERYFFFGLGDGVQSNAFEESSSEIFSDCSDNQDTVATNVGYCDKKTAIELSTSRLEKYFLSGFMGFSGETKSDGSVGSDSEGHPSPSQRKKKYVRARGTQRSNNSSLDNLIVETVELTNEQSMENLYSSESETGSFSEPGAGYDKLENGENMKRKKNYRKRELEQKISNECSSNAQPINKKKGSSTNEHSDVEKPKGSELTGAVNLQASLPKTSLIRKDSFNNWSSDEETNLMMSKMRQFFKTLIAVTSQNNSQTNKFGTHSGNFLKEKPLQRRNKSFQISYFENELVRLMKTVPGINNQQVREIVEYFSSEDAWSDSNDSSDCNRPNSDAIHKKLKKPSPIEPSSTGSARVSALNDDWIDEHCAVNSDNVLLYTDLIESLIKTNTNFSAEKVAVDEESHNHICTEQSPQMLANVMQHIGRKLVALMHDVKIGGDIIPGESSELSRSNDTVNPEENSTKSIVDHIDCSSSRRGQLPRSQSHDVLLGSSNPSWLFNSNNAVNETAGEVSDCDRFSWRGSFESALLAPVDSGSKLLNFDRDNCSLTSDASIAKRGSADNITYTIIKSKEQLDRVQSCGSIGGGDNQSTSEAKPVWQSSLTDIKHKNELEKDANRIHIEGHISTNSLPRLQSMQFSSEMPDKSISDSNVVQSNAKSARYRSPVAQIVFPKSLSKRNTFQPSRPYQLSSLQRGMTASASLDDFSISEFSISKSPELERNKLYRRNNTNFGVRSDSLTSVYSDNFENRFGNVKVKGQIEFGMQYNYKISALEIHIIKCKDLAIADIKRCKSDPYVKAYLLPDKSKSGKRKTKVKKNTLNPAFDEVIRFYVSISDLKTRSIWLTVWHSDIFGRNEFLGQVVIDLQEKVFDNPQSQWYTLQEKSRSLDSNSGYHGDLVVGLKFVTPESTQANKTDCAFVRRKESIKSLVKGQLHILVKEAKNLRSPRTSGTCDTFCKSYLLPNRTRSSKQKTPVVKKSLNPVWNCTFVYDNVTLQDLSERALELTIWDHDRLISNHLLGGVRFSLGSEKQGKKLNWMDSQGKELFLWQEMINRPNFWVEGSVNLRLNLELKTEENNEC